jgi:NAD(P)-dependent dehydrogenase (short-subunit alcohol dehydrogenase family)
MEGMTMAAPTRALQGKVAVITGASTEIGRACAAVFAREGMSVVLAARRADRLKAAVSEVAATGADVLGVATDVASYDDMTRLGDAAIGAFGHVDVAFLNAGISSGSPLTALDLESWQRAVGTNIFGLLNGIKVFLPLLDRQDDAGSLLATSSAAGIHGTSYNTDAYAMTKNAQLSVMESLYGQLRDARSGVHVGVVLPPLTRTNLAGDDLEVWTQVEAMLSKRPDAPALIEPDQFAEVVLEGLLQRSFWIEATADQNQRFFEGRDPGAAARKARLVGAKADAVVQRIAPDPYLW